MENIYQDIANRTNGDIYIGVVGPVRVGKSTFITQFMQKFVLPNMQNDSVKTFAIDELPQSADGAGIMTTQPKFVPNNAVKIDVDGICANIRLIDCVGYLIEGAQGDRIDGQPRMINTPWSDQPMPFAKAAEFGTKKVVTQHSTVAVLVTTDGSFGAIPRQNFVESEKRLVNELKEQHKPFVVVLNSAHPSDKKTLALQDEMQANYGCRVLAIDVSKLDSQDVQKIFSGILEDFDVTAVEMDMPQWLTALPFDNPIIQEICTQLSNATQGADKVVSFTTGDVLFEDSERFEPIKTSNVDMGTGRVVYQLVPKPDLFYNVLSMQCGMEIHSDYELISNIKNLARAKCEYDRLRAALEDVNTTGYGVVQPAIEDLEFEEPEVIKQGGKYGVRLRASAPSIHLVRVDLETEISPIIGTEEQSKELIEYINKKREENINEVWQINMFGRSLQTMMTGGLEAKINSMPIDAQRKMRKTLTRIVNEGKGGIICILL